MPPTFNVLSHPQRDEIIAAITSGSQSTRVIAGRYDGLSQSGVHRFKQFWEREHSIEIEIASKEAAKAAILMAGEALVEATDMARDDEDTRALIAAARSLDDHALAMGKVGGWLQDNISVTNGDASMQQKLIKVLVAELTPIPGALEALERALGKIDADIAKDITPADDSPVIEHAAE